MPFSFCFSEYGPALLPAHLRHFCLPPLPFLKIWPTDSDADAAGGGSVTFRIAFMRNIWWPFIWMAHLFVVFPSLYSACNGSLSLPLRLLIAIKIVSHHLLVSDMTFCFMTRIINCQLSSMYKYLKIKITEKIIRNLCKKIQSVMARHSCFPNWLLRFILLYT